MSDAAPIPPFRFMKMHGAGNDFVILDTRGGQAGVGRQAGVGGRLAHPALVRALGDRNRGVGFDQLAEIRTAPQGDVDFALDFWNCDGSQAEACGNASRCAALYMMEALGKESLRFLTRRGVLEARRLGDGRVSVNMGAPQLTWREIPLAREVDPLHLPLERDAAALGMGNPHCVLFTPDAEAVDLAALGPLHEHDPLFPQGANVEFVSPLGPNHLRMRVWERGVGVTLACGSGACAAAVAAAQRGLTGRKVRLTLDGGALEVDWRDDGVWLAGPAARVFTGELAREFLAALAPPSEEEGL